MALIEIQECINDLTTRISAVPSVAKNNVVVYSQDEATTGVDRMAKPAAFLIYMGLNGSEDGAKTGLFGPATFDIYVVGGSVCVNSSTDGTVGASTIAILKEIRDCIKDQKAPPGHKWKFVYERPTFVSDSDVAYVQRWETRVPLTG